jgi:hypothetical protein
MKTFTLICLGLLSSVLAACSALQGSSLPTVPPDLATTAADIPQAALNAQQALADQLQIGVDSIQIVQVEPVEWPDACLGITKTDIACAQVVTPGYRVILSANGQTYEFHTNQSGVTVELASTPAP